MTYETLPYETEGKIGILTYNRPKVVNAINKQMLDELNDFWQMRLRDFDTRVIIHRGRRLVVQDVYHLKMDYKGPGLES